MSIIIKKLITLHPYGIFIFGSFCKFILKFSFLRNIIYKYKYKDSSQTLIYVHIDKCGGSTVERNIFKSKKIIENFSRIHKIHQNKPPIHKKSKYIIVVRNPLSRLVSAFNWRYRLLVKEENNYKNYFKKELNILKKYKNINSIAEQLYFNEKLNKNVAKEFKKIIHIKNDMEFYLGDLLKSISKDQIFAVLCQETINADIKNYLSLNNNLNINDNNNRSLFKKHLTVTSQENLKKWSINDFKILKNLAIKIYQEKILRDTGLL